MKSSFVKQLNKTFLFFHFALFILIKSTLTSAQPIVSSIKELQLIGLYDINHNQSFNNTTIGGLSGIDYDTSTNTFYAISDDRSAINSSRFYTLSIACTPIGIDTVVFKSVTYLHQKDGSLYPNNKQNAYQTPDPEAIRYNPITKQILWTSEGERIVNSKDTILENPTIIAIDTLGKFVDSFSLPSLFIMNANEIGPRQNGVFEGATFSDNYKNLWISVEEPLYQDAPRADTIDVNPFVRILKYNVSSKQNIAQYAYKLSSVAYPPSPASSFKVNGVTDILSISKDKLLVMERSYSTGKSGCSIKIFEADFTKATDIKNIQSLKENSHFIPATKKLLLNMDNLHRYIDNVEGMTLGPILPNKHKTIVMVSDNNFLFFQKTQLLLFEVIE